uniref:Cytochrome P450 n=1 Tax=Acrobeloides nanus TaxID=290746 RepID=A0A914CC27_9BILA
MNILPVDPENKHNLGQNMITLKEGEEWRRVRNLLTPAFTTGKLRMLIPEFNHCSKDLAKIIEKYAEDQKDIPLKDLMNKFTMSVIARTAFAADVNAFDDEEAPILQNSKELFDIFRSKGSVSLFFLRKEIKILKNVDGD